MGLATSLEHNVMYGCGEAKLASTLNKPKSEGKKLMDSFWISNAPLQDVVAALEHSYHTNGYITGLDGRRIMIRDKRKLLNSLLQSGAAVVFKTWTVKCNGYYSHLVTQNKLKLIISYHDESQYESYNSSKYIAEARGEEVCLIAKDVGDQLKIKVPIEAEYKVGKNWSETH